MFKQQVLMQVVAKAITLTKTMKRNQMPHLRHKQQRSQKRLKPQGFVKLQWLRRAVTLMEW